MFASVDVGSNTVRLLIAEVVGDSILPQYYWRQITRLGGGFTPTGGLSADAKDRTMKALKEIARRIGEEDIEAIQAVGTAAFRKAVNGETFADAIRVATNLPFRILTGNEEARFSFSGVHAALFPKPSSCLIFDLGGGSTEFTLCREEQILFQRSYPLGVVNLCEEASDAFIQQQWISRIINQLQQDLAEVDFPQGFPDCLLVGTAGTVTTLAAIHLKMALYDWRRINNLILTLKDLQSIHLTLRPLSIEEREALPGLEPGRGDLIIPGLIFIQTLMDQLAFDTLKVSDFGLLEGLLLSTGG